MKNTFFSVLVMSSCLTGISNSVTAQEQRFQITPDATGGVWIFDTIQGAVSKCVRPEPRPQDGNQPRLANPFEFYEDGNGTPHCSDWTTLSEETNEN